MDNKVKELIALGASVAAHCQPCLAWHLGKARGSEIAEDDIRAAIEIGFMVEKGAGNAMKKYAGESIKQSQSPDANCCSGNSKCCK